MMTNYLTQSQIIGKAYQMYAEETKSLFLQYNICNEDAEDLVQEVFVRVLGIDTICTETIKGLVMVVAFNLRKDYFRRQASRKKAFEKYDAGDLAYFEESHIIANDIERVEMSVADNSLNDTNCAIYKLSRINELNAEEIADEMGLEVRNVESRLYYSRKIMRKKLAMAL